MDKQTILIVDDEHDLLDLIEYNACQNRFKMSHIRIIREKRGSDYIETVKGVGYRFKE